MPLARYPKAPGETKRYSIDYDDWLDTGETILDVEFTVSPVTVPPLVVGSVMLEASIRAMQFLVSGGVDGRTYEVLVEITTSGAQIKEDELVYAVKEL